MQALKGAKGQALLLGAGLLLLSGCGLPPAVAVASYVADAGSFVATGKTATDHGVSAVAGEDCMLMRMLEGPVCQPAPQYAMAGEGVLEPLGPKPLAQQQALLPQARFLSSDLKPAEALDPLAGMGYLADEGLALEALVRDAAGPQL